MDYAKLGAELYQIVRLAFLQSVAGNLLGTIQGEIEAGTATYAQALAFASDSGRILAALMREQMVPGVIPDDIMHAEIAENMITPLMTDQYALVAEVCVQVQQNLNDRYGVNLAPQRPEFRQERADGIARSVSGRLVNDIGASFDNAVENYSMSVVDDSVRTNAEFQYEAGFEPQIIRTADAGACEWCQERAGTYEYARVRRKGSEVYRRHANCKCVVEFVPGNGRRQNVHTKEWRRENPDDRIINDRRRFAYQEQLNRYTGLAGNIVRNPRILGTYTPVSLKAALEANGNTILALGNGRLAGKPFEQGGGYRVLFNGDGYIQYHPEVFSRHGGAYYKVSSGPTGTRWFNIDGQEIDRFGNVI